MKKCLVVYERPLIYFLLTNKFVLDSLMVMMILVKVVIDERRCVEKYIKTETWRLGRISESFVIKCKAHCIAND